MVESKRKDDIQTWRMDIGGQFQSSNDGNIRNNDKENKLLEKQKSYHRALLDCLYVHFLLLPQEEVNKFPEDKKEALHFSYTYNYNGK